MRSLACPPTLISFLLLVLGACGPSGSGTEPTDAAADSTETNRDSATMQEDVSSVDTPLDTNLGDATASSCGVCTETCCGDDCVDTNSAIGHCGGCDLPCDMQRADRCTAASCRCGDGPACNGTSVCMGGACQSGIMCGTCGGGSICDFTTGDCRCNGDDIWQTGETCCGDTSVDLMSDLNNCGVCGKRCMNSGKANECNSGTCECYGSPPCGDPGPSQSVCACVAVTSGSEGCFDPTKPSDSPC